jgi:hypothetical protein
VEETYRRNSGEFTDSDEEYSYYSEEGEYYDEEDDSQLRKYRVHSRATSKKTKTVTFADSHISIGGESEIIDDSISK